MENRARGRIGLPLCMVLSLILYGWSSVSAQAPQKGTLKIEMKSYKIEGTVINIEQGHSEMLKGQIPAIQKGMRELLRLFGSVPATGRKMWFAASGIEMEGVLTDGIKISDRRIVIDSMRRRSYADADHIAVMYDPSVPPERLVRFVLSEYALDLMDAKAPSRRDERAAPIYYGLSEYLGWYAYAISNNLSWNEAEARLCSDFLKKYKDREEESVYDDLSSAAWRDSIAKYGEEAFSESVLGAVFLVRLTGIAQAVQFFDRYEKGDAKESFQKTAGIGVDEFRKRLRDQFIPDLRRSESGGGE